MSYSKSFIQKSSAQQLKDEFKSLRNALKKEFKISLKSFRAFAIKQESFYSEPEAIDKIRLVWYCIKSDYALLKMLHEYKSHLENQ